MAGFRLPGPLGLDIAGWILNKRNSMMCPSDSGEFERIRSWIGQGLRDSPAQSDYLLPGTLGVGAGAGKREDKFAIVGDTLVGTGVVQQPISDLSAGTVQGPKAIVLHRTGGSTASGAISAFKSSGIGTHFVVDKDGTVYQTLRLSSFGWHVGKIKAKCKELGTCTKDDREKLDRFGWNPQAISNYETRHKEYPDRYPTSEESIGVEVVGKFDSVVSRWDEATDKQLESVRKLVECLKEHYKFSSADIYQHDEISYKTVGEGAGLGY